MKDEERYKEIEKRIKERNPEDKGCAERVMFPIFFIFVVVLLFSSTASAENNLVVKQPTILDCLPAALATHLNYKEGVRAWETKHIRAMYFAKYNRLDYFRDGKTSNELFTLVDYIDGYQSQSGKLPAAWFLAEIVRQKKYPIIFLDGQVKHAVVAIDIDKAENVSFADPLDGNLKLLNLYTLFHLLEKDKWYFYGTGEMK